MAGFIVIEKQNLAATLATLRMLHNAGNVEGFENCDEAGIPSKEGKYDLIRVDGDSRFVEFAMKNQGYARVVRAWHG